MLFFFGEEVISTTERAVVVIIIISLLQLGEGDRGERGVCFGFLDTKRTPSLRVLTCTFIVMGT